MSSFQFMQKLLGRIAEQGRRLVAPPAAENELEQKDIAELCRALLSERGEASGIAAAYGSHEAYRALDTNEKADFFDMLATEFGPNHAGIKSAIDRYLTDPSDANAGKLHTSAEPKRQELFRRLNRSRRGTERLVSMREDMLPLLKKNAALADVDLDFHHLLSSWFNPGFLVLERIDWGSPAAVLEKIIRYEAVHEIRSWDDLRRRIEPTDRCCYAYFHPTLVDEPLIFVEVALTKETPSAIQPILSENRSVIDEREATTAVFYSISNCQAGLRGISFGNFLIKRVVEELKRDLPELETFVTLSPVPTFRRWLKGLSDKDKIKYFGSDHSNILGGLDKCDWPDEAPYAERLRDSLMPVAAEYFLNAKTDRGLPVDPVARFHLGNGARLERINWLGDRSKRGMKQGAGLMVNYLYDLDEIEQNHELFVNHNTVAASNLVKAMVRDEPVKNPSTLGDQSDRPPAQDLKLEQKMKRQGPLQDLLVIDLSRVLAGPYATMVLADLGARVIKIETPETGDDARHFPPFMEGKSAYFMSLNRGKESIVLNLKSKEDCAVFEQLVAQADILVENYRPGTMEKLGYGWDKLQTLNERLIYSAISGFGHSGPYSKRPAYDMVVQGMGGIMSVTGYPDSPPTRVGTSIGDITAGLFGTAGILAALHDRERTGKGTFVDVAMLDCQVAILENAISRYLADGKVPGPLGARHPSITPFEAYRAKDGYIIIAAGNDALFAKLCDVLDKTELMNDPDFKTNPLRTEHSQRLKENIEDALSSDTCETWLTRITDAGVPCGPINNVEQVVNDAHVNARNMIITAEDQTAGKVQMAGNPIKLSTYNDPSERSPAPELDGDRDAISKLVAEPAS